MHKRQPMLGGQNLVSSPWSSAQTRRAPHENAPQSGTHHRFGKPFSPDGQTRFGWTPTNLQIREIFGVQPQELDGPVRECRGDVVGGKVVPAGKE